MALTALTIPQVNAQEKQNAEANKKTTFNDAAAALSNKSLGNLFPMYDEQVNQIIRICDKGGDITGSVNALVSLGVYLGSEISNEEEEILIRGSKVDVNAYTEICKSVVTSFSKPQNGSIVEAGYILDFIENGKAQEILAGIKILAKAKYRMRTGSELIVNPEKLQLWADVGNVNEKDFQSIYKSLLNVGMQEELNEISVKAIIALVKESKADKVVTAVASLSSTGWRCEGEFDHREQKVIRNLINNRYEESVSIKAEPLSDARLSDEE